jgi:hypothetical protein
MVMFFHFPFVFLIFFSNLYIHTHIYIYIFLIDYFSFVNFIFNYINFTIKMGFYL